MPSVNETARVLTSQIKRLESLADDEDDAAEDARADEAEAAEVFRSYPTAMYWWATGFHPRQVTGRGLRGRKSLRSPRPEPSRVSCAAPVSITVCDV